MRDHLAQRMMHPVTTEEGAAFARQAGAQAFVECSSFTQVGLKEAFETAVRVGRAHREQQVEVRRKKKGLCTVM